MATGRIHGIARRLPRACAIERPRRFEQRLGRRQRGFRQQQRRLDFVFDEDAHRRAGVARLELQCGDERGPARRGGEGRMHHDDFGRLRQQVVLEQQQIGLRDHRHEIGVRHPLSHRHYMLGPDDHEERRSGCDRMITRTFATQHMASSKDAADAAAGFGHPALHGARQALANRAAMDACTGDRERRRLP